ncbi:MAG: SUMF1/EgtB/PvdO family nonheme iron enzyme [Gemmatimonadota bacterium]|nr:SUMF1/EgtB/PvdO family nonheme iron enzyme [Gemmatimonadota bacterium]
MRRNAIVGLFALAAMLTAKQLLIAQSGRDADFDANGIVDFGDFILFAQAFGSNQSNFDLDGSGNVDFPDFILFAQRFGQGMPEEDITVTLPRGIKLEMVWIQPGRFIMGSPTTESKRDDDEGPQHEVTITKGFYLGKYEVTQEQWEAVMNTRPWSTPGVEGDPRKAKFPAFNLSWREVNTFLRRLNEAQESEVFRLPTEAEWEYACRAGTTTAWSFGSDSSRVGSYARYYENSRSATVLENGIIAYGNPEPQETGGVFANPWGLYDMHGNVWEWVQDVYGPYAGEPQTDPTGPDQPTPAELAGYAYPGEFIVVRGGGFLDTVQEVRSAVRMRGRAWRGRAGVRVLMVRR